MSLQLQLYFNELKKMKTLNIFRNNIWLNNDSNNEKSSDRNMTILLNLRRDVDLKSNMLQLRIWTIVFLLKDIQKEYHMVNMDILIQEVITELLNDQTMKIIFKSLSDLLICLRIFKIIILLPLMSLNWVRKLLKILIRF